jgi:hypothetical protein
LNIASRCLKGLCCAQGAPDEVSASRSWLVEPPSSIEALLMNAVPSGIENSWAETGMPEWDFGWLILTIRALLQVTSFRVKPLVLV